MKTLICIGGGELRERTTLKIDEYIANLAKQRAGDKRANALFIPTASHDFMPYYNTFHKVYTGVFNVKTDVALTVFRESDLEKLRAKFEKADMIYVGGGDTLFMIDSWKTSGIADLLVDAYNRGVIICGLSAGAICWFKEMFTDSASLGTGDKYSVQKGLGWFDGLVCPHYNARKDEFDSETRGYAMRRLALSDDSAIILRDGEIVGSLTSGGTAYSLENDNLTPILPVLNA
ncbi:MAG: peptidase E [Clostridia bacterium]|nr:peptidase E [Clostridia bacterium]